MCRHMLQACLTTSSQQNRASPSCVLRMASELPEGRWDDGQERACFPLGLLHMLPRPSCPQSTPHLLLMSPAALAVPPEAGPIGTATPDKSPASGAVVSPVAGPQTSSGSIQLLLRWVPAGLRSLKLVGLVGKEGTAPEATPAARAIFEVELRTEQGTDVTRRHGKPTKLFEIRLPPTLLQGIQQPTPLMVAVTADRPDAVQHALDFWSNLQNLGGSTRPEASLLAQLGCLTGNLAPVHYAASILLLPPALATEVEGMWQQALIQQRQATSSTEASESSLRSRAAVDLAPAGDDSKSLATAVWEQAHVWLGDFAAFVADMAALLQVSGRELQGDLTGTSIGSTHRTRQVAPSIKLARQLSGMSPLAQERLAVLALRCLPVVDNLMGHLLTYQSQGIPLPRLSSCVQYCSSVVHSALQLLHSTSLAGRRGSSNVFDESLLSSGMLGASIPFQADVHPGIPYAADVHLDPWEGGPPLNYFQMPPPSPIRNPSLDWGAAPQAPEGPHLWHNAAVPPSPFASVPVTPATPVRERALGYASITVPSGGAHAIMNLQELEVITSAPLFKVGMDSSFEQLSGQPRPAVQSAGPPSKAAEVGLPPHRDSTSSVLSLPANVVQPVLFEGTGISDKANAAPPVREYLWEQQSIVSGALHASSSCGSLSNARSTVLTGAFSGLNARSSEAHARLSDSHARTSSTYARTSGTYARTSGTFGRSSADSGAMYLRGSLESTAGLQGLRNSHESGVSSRLRRSSRDETTPDFMGATFVPCVFPATATSAMAAEPHCIADLPSTAVTTRVGALLTVAEEQSTDSRDETPSGSIVQQLPVPSPAPPRSSQATAETALGIQTLARGSLGTPAMTSTLPPPAFQAAARGMWYSPAAPASTSRAPADLAGTLSQADTAPESKQAPTVSGCESSISTATATAATIAAPTTAEAQQSGLQQTLPLITCPLQALQVPAHLQPQQSSKLSLTHSVLCGCDDAEIEMQYLRESSEQLSERTDPYVCVMFVLLFACGYLMLGHARTHADTSQRLHPVAWLVIALIALCKSASTSSWLLPQGTAGQLSAVHLGNISLNLTNRSRLISLCLAVESVFWLLLAGLVSRRTPGSTMEGRSTDAGGVLVAVLNCVVTPLMLQVPFRTMWPIMLVASLSPISALCPSSATWFWPACFVTLMSLGITAALDASSRARFLSKASKPHAE